MTFAGVIFIPPDRERKTWFYVFTIKLGLKKKNGHVYPISMAVISPLRNFLDA